MEITEIKAALEKDPALKDQILPLVADGKIIRTKEEDQQFLDNHVNAVVEERVKAKVQSAVDDEFGKALTKIDEQIKAITGIEKQPNEKTTAYAKRAIEEKHNKGGDPITKEKVKQLEELLEKSKTESENQLKDLRQQYERKDIESKLDAYLSTKQFPLPAHLKTEEEKQAYLNGQRRLLKQDFLTNYPYKKDNDGNIIFYEGDKPLLSTKDAKALNVESIVEEKYNPWFIPAGTQQTGTGTGQQSGVVPANGSFKDKESIHKHLAAQGLDALSKEYGQQFEKIATENNISI